MSIKPRRWHLAVHEAGHAVAATVLGGQVTWVSIRRHDQSAGRCWHNPTDLSPHDQAVIFLAGPATGVLLGDLDEAAWSLGGDDHHDGPAAQTLADTHGFEIGDAAEAAAEIVASHWPAIEATARSLRGSRRGIISGDKVHELVQRSPVRKAPTPPASTLNSQVGRV